MVHGSAARCAIAASLEAVLSVWRPNAVADAWHAKAKDAPWALSHTNMTCRALRARHRAREAAAALAAVDVGEVESHSPAPRMDHQFGQHNCVLVDVVGLSKTDPLAI